MLEMLGLGKSMGWLIGLAAAASGIKIIRQYERGVKFTLGKYSGVMKPGLNWIIPLVQTMEKVDIRQQTLNLQPQSVMTKDNVNLTIDGVVFFNIARPEQVILNVEDLERQLEDKASSELKEIVGSMDMTDALGKREEIATKLKLQIDKAIYDEGAAKENKKEWGIVVRAIQINNVVLPESLVRAMAKEAEASREKKAILIRSQGEKEAAKNYQEAAKVYGMEKGALALRQLKTYEEIGKEQNTLMLVIPSEMATGDGRWVLPFASAYGKDVRGEKDGKRKSD